MSAPKFTPGKLALIQIGYQHYAVPIEELPNALASFDRLRKVGYRYETGFVYWYEDDKGEPDVSVQIVPADRILASEPEKLPAPKKEKATPKAKDERVLVASGDTPMVIGALPPLREFVNEHRDEDQEGPL